MIPMRRGTEKSIPPERLVRSEGPPVHCTGGPLHLLFYVILSRSDKLWSSLHLARPNT